ncbi:MULTISPECIES: DMT family transporter [Paenibacillus]|uniref:DMT family transporter n=1 Tax=Paenibacillus TaxID=44249 RepID=UPI00096FD489|nr:MULTISPECIES: DMT family transporter [Paenibacillus]AWP26080.1 EamA family transporter [Paenibacillus sp. Cedars]MPY18482.1 DMT family transporter [Paenibacillus glucanolyticus]OMF78163.1 EamA family transporter [Paenibacillus glucanolyticus]
MKRARIADLSLLVVAMMWGSTFLIVQHAVRVLPPMAFNSVRFLGAALLLAFIITVFYRSQWKQISGKMLVHACLLGLFLFIGYAFQTAGLLYTTTSNTGFITGLSVVLVPFISYALLKHAISKFTWISALLAAAGLYLLTFTGSGIRLNQGDLLVLVCAIGFALHIGYTGIYAGRYPSLLLAALQMAVVGICSLIASVVTEHVGNTSDLVEKLTQPNVLWALAVSIGPTSAFAFWIQTVCQKYTTPSRVAIIYATEPVFAALTGILFAGERLTLIGGIGCLCILAGMMIAELKSAPQKVQ